MRSRWIVLVALLIGLVGMTALGQDKGVVYYLAPNQFDEMQTTAAASIKQLVEEAGYECRVLVAGAEDITLQIDQLETAIVMDPVAIILAAVDTVAIAPSIEKARAAGIPVIVYDRVVSGTYVDFTSVAGCKKIGILAGHEIARLLKEKYGEVRGKVLSIMGDPGDMYTVLIEEGFREVMADYPEVNITTKINYGWEATTGADIVESWLVAHPDTDLLFPHADHMAAATASRLETAGYEKGEIFLVSTAGMPMGLTLVREGWCQVTVEQPVIAQALGVAMFLDQIVSRQCPKPDTYNIGGLEAVLMYEDYGPVLLLPGGVITIENVDDPKWWGNQAGK
jgi:ribose transport system substrate-binding protein